MRLLRAGLAGLALMTGAAFPGLAAWFSDNGERAPLSELREKPAEALSAVERALLTAANRTGWVEIPACGMGSNGVLVSVAGQDYVITSLHLLIGKLPSQKWCDPASPALYYPYAAYRNPDLVGGLRGLPQTVYLLAPEPLNYSGAGVAMPWVSDWVAYRLTPSLSKQPMPEGTWAAGESRGAFTLPEKIDASAPVYVLGYDSRFEAASGWQFSWQACRQRRQSAELRQFSFDCDIAPGASSSPVMAMAGGEMVLLGIVSASMQPMIGPDQPVPQAGLYWNLATDSRAMRDLLYGKTGSIDWPGQSLGDWLGLPER